MPAVSKKQQQFMAMVEHGKIKGPPGLSKEEAGHFSKTPTKGLPVRVKKNK